MHYEVIIIGAGMSGLAAGIRLAYFGKNVCILEKHYAYGGLNSYYKRDGWEFDVGLHAVTNYAPRGARSGPLPKLLRQLRLKWDDFDLCPQRFSEIHFPGRRLRFSNDIQLLGQEVSEQFPGDADNFQRLLEHIRAYDDTRFDHPYRATRPILGQALRDPMLVDMLLCPIMFYGSPEEHDLDFTHFVTLFKSLMCEGFARPRAGVRTIIKTLVRKYRACGGKLKMRSGVAGIQVNKGRVTGLTTDSGETLTADVVFSSAGYPETMRLCSDENGTRAPDECGRLSFVETIGIMDELPHRLGHEAAIVFYSDTEKFTYARPVEAVDVTSGVICCPSNYERHDDMPHGIFRMTWLANYDRWSGFDDATYAATKKLYYQKFVDRATECIPGFRRHVVYSDMFTPRTIQHYTGRINGAVYGAPHKRRDGRTRIENLFICGTDQGYVGIVGAMLSGILMANQHVLYVN